MCPTFRETVSRWRRGSSTEGPPNTVRTHFESYNTAHSIHPQGQRLLMRSSEWFSQSRVLGLWVMLKSPQMVLVAGSVRARGLRVPLPSHVRHITRNYDGNGPVPSHDIFTCATLHLCLVGLKRPKPYCRGLVNLQRKVGEVP